MVGLTRKIAALFGMLVATTLLVSTAQSAPDDGTGFNLAGLNVAIGSKIYNLNETVSTTTKRYTVDVPHDARDLKVYAAWSKISGCRMHNYNGENHPSECGDPNGATPKAKRLFGLDPRPGFTTWYCSNCEQSSYTVYRDITLYKKGGVAYWANSETAEQGFPGNFRTHRPGQLLNNGHHTLVSSGGQYWQ